jgi:hypothetical protein
MREQPNPFDRNGHMPQSSDGLRDHFDRLVDAPPDERASVLAQLRLDRPSVAAELERLLRAHDAGPPLEPLIRLYDAPDAAPPERLLADGEEIETPLGRAVVRRLLSEIVGAASEVYEIELRDAGSRGGACALKLLRDPLPSLDASRRFAVEAESLRRTRSPGIAEFLKAGPVRRAGGESRRGILTRLVHGERFDRWAEGRPLAERARAIAAIARAVQDAHRQGVIHRDLKPSNVVVESDGRPIVLDLGVAKLRADEPGQPGMPLATTTRAIVGTFGYMAPEQFVPLRVPVDTRADVYALGVMLYEQIEGRLPVDVADCAEVEAYERKRNARIVGPGGATMHRLLGQVALAALATDPAGRHGSAEAFADDIEDALALRPSRRRGLGPVARLWLFARRHPLGAIAMFLVVVASSAVIAQRVHAQRQIAAARDRAEARFADTRSFARWIIEDFTCELTGIVGTAGARRALVEEASRTLTRLASDPDATDELLLEIVDGYGRLSEILENETFDKAVSLRGLERAREVLARIEGDPPLARLFRAWIEFRIVISLDGEDPPDAEVPVLLASLATFEELEALLPDDPRLPRWRVLMRMHLSRRQLEPKHGLGATPEEILAGLDAMVADAERAAALAPNDPVAASEPSFARFWRAHGASDLNRAEARDFALDALASAEELGRSGNPRGLHAAGRARALLARITSRNGHVEEFLREARRAISDLDAAAAREPDVRLYLRTAEVARSQLAYELLASQSAPDDAMLEEGLAWALESREIYRRREARGWADAFERERYPALCDKLVDAVRAEIERRAATP